MEDIIELREKRTVSDIPTLPLKIEAISQHYYRAGLVNQKFTDVKYLYCGLFYFSNKTVAEVGSDIIDTVNVSYCIVI